MSEVTQILSAIESGDPKAAEQLLPLVYEELRRLAAQRLAQEKPGQTLQATALVHEAYVRLTANQADPGREAAGESRGAWHGRGHFFAAAAEAMRRILIEQARRKGREKHGGGLRRVELDGACRLADSPDPNLLALDEALTRLEAADSLAAQIVKLRYFAGLTMPETAQSLGISLRQAERNWTYAKAWLHRELTDAR
jgi:RNA polymerase sigma factor (TIGR02999 family)